MESHSLDFKERIILHWHFSPSFLPF